MRDPTELTIRRLAIVSLIFFIFYTLALQPFALPVDSNLLAVLRWRHYGSILSPILLWYAAVTVAVLAMLALLGIAVGVRSGRWALLVSFLLGLFLSCCGGLAMFTALSRTLGGIAQICATAVLTLTFIGSGGVSSNHRLERP
jgi:hypothetical protein